LSPDLEPTIPLAGCTFTVLVHTREAATRNMEKIQVIKVRDIFGYLMACEQAAEQRLEITEFWHLRG